ncbi:hypothetical protein [Aurantimonas sp. C2-4-R8]|uniref:hypothetical protein n=1 Tax=Aurantimonas sp. C2-4-R8 TaxID=3114364 RepID=UPI002E192C30
MTVTGVNDLETAMFWALSRALLNCERSGDTAGARQALSEIDDICFMTDQRFLETRCRAILAQRRPIAAQARPE